MARRPLHSHLQGAAINAVRRGSAAGRWLGIVCALGISSVSAEAQSLSTQEYILLDNSGNDQYVLVGNGSSDGSAATASASRSFTGQDGAGSTRTMGFVGTVTASAGYGQLHCDASGTVTNTYYNASNPIFYNSSTGVVDPNGSPTSLSSLGFANFSDTLQYGGALQAGYQARYIFHVDGTNSGYGATAGLGVNIAGNDESFFATSPGDLSTDWATASYAINGQSPQTISAQFSSQFVLNTPDVADGSTITGESNFSSTARLVGIQILDANGNPVSGVTVTSASGMVYSIVPEPTSLAFLLPAAFWMLFHMRRSISKGRIASPGGSPAATL